LTNKKLIIEHSLGSTLWTKTEMKLNRKLVDSETSLLQGGLAGWHKSNAMSVQAIAVTSELGW
jgi:hypothetical protein